MCLRDPEAHTSSWLKGIVTPCSFRCAYLGRKLPFRINSGSVERAEFPTEKPRVPEGMLQNGVVDAPIKPLGARNFDCVISVPDSESRFNDSAFERAWGPVV